MGSWGRHELTAGSDDDYMVLVRGLASRRRLGPRARHRGKGRRALRARSRRLRRARPAGRLRRGRLLGRPAARRARRRHEHEPHAPHAARAGVGRGLPCGRARRRAARRDPGLPVATRCATTARRASCSTTSCATGARSASTSSPRTATAAAAGWGLRNAKLRTSRKLLFASGLLPVLRCHELRAEAIAPFLAAQFAMPPTDRVADAFLRYGAPAEGAAALAAYDALPRTARRRRRPRRAARDRRPRRRRRLTALPRRSPSSARRSTTACSRCCSRPSWARSRNATQCCSAQLSAQAPQAPTARRRSAPAPAGTPRRRRRAAARARRRLDRGDVDLGEPVGEGVEQLVRQAHARVVQLRVGDVEAEARVRQRARSSARSSATVRASSLRVSMFSSRSRAPRSANAATSPSVSGCITIPSTYAGIAASAVAERGRRPVPALRRAVHRDVAERQRVRVGEESAAAPAARAPTAPTARPRRASSVSAAATSRGQSPRAPTM